MRLSYIRARSWRDTLSLPSSTTEPFRIFLTMSDAEFLDSFFLYNLNPLPSNDELEDSKIPPPIFSQPNWFTDLESESSGISSTNNSFLGTGTLNVPAPEFNVHESEPATTLDSPTVWVHELIGSSDFFEVAPQSSTSLDSDSEAHDYKYVLFIKQLYRKFI